MNKTTFIENMKDTNIFNEKFLWGLVYDYIDKCFVCNKLLDNEKRHYSLRGRRICFICLIEKKFLNKINI